MPQKITPCLWFDNRAEEAVKFYTAVFKDGKVKKITRYGKTGPGKEGDLLTAIFEIQGQEFMILNGGPEFKFTEAISFVINCRDQDELDYFWDKLLEGGSPQQCGWLKDKYGLSWQVVPTVIDELLTTGDPKKTDNMMKALLQMVKLDIAKLEEAYNEG